MSQRQPHSTLAVWPVRSRHLLNSIPTVIYVLAITAKGFPSQWVSDSVKRILGYEVEEALAPDWWIDCLHPDDKEAAVGKTSILMTQGHLVQEYRFRSKDGHYLWMQDEASLLRKADGRPKEIVGFWTNITERKQAEKQAAQAHEQEVDSGELNRSSNRIAVRLVIVALIVGSSFLLLADKGPLMWGMTITGLTVFAVGCSLGSILIWLVVKSGKRSRHILNSIPTVIYVLAITAKGFRGQWVSDSVKRILGYEVEEALAPDWWIDGLHPDDKEAAVEKTSILKTRGHLVQEYRFRCKDGHYLWMQDEASLLRKAFGRRKEIVGFWTNITERKQAEEQAAQTREQEVESGELNRSSDRNIAVGLVIAALIVGSSFLFFAGNGPLMWGETIIGLTVFAVGCSLGLILIWLVVKSGKY
ncbi:MAG: PAS domain-containing protein [Pseudomonadota bacterium]|nr:PAS domain-containing protein [Pseudomonadota bacterium]